MKIGPSTRHAALLAALISVQGCTGTRIGDGPLNEGHRAYPDTNPNPTKIVQVSGTIAPEIQINVVATYRASAYSKCTTSPTLIAGAISGAKFPEYVELKIPIEIANGNFNFSVAQDHFAPTNCNWSLSAVTAELQVGHMRTREPLGFVQRITHEIVTRDKDGAVKDVSQVMAVKEDLFMNASPAPVIKACQIKTDDQTGQKSLDCHGDPRRKPIKQAHVIYDQTRSFLASISLERPQPAN